MGFILPYRIAFSEDDGEEWGPYDIIEMTMNGIFFIDIVLNFFTAYYDENENLVLDRAKIAKSYLFSWFFIDVVSTVPLQNIFVSVSNYNNMIRISKIPKIFRFVKMTRLIRLTRIFKERRKILNFFVDYFKIHASYERMVLSVITIVILCHLFACIWYIIISFEDEDAFSWDKRFLVNQDYSSLDFYIASFYFILQTCVTTGYGDINALTTQERLFAIIWMFIGCFLYSFIIGALTSLLLNVDSKRAQYQENLRILLMIKKEYGVDDELFAKINKFLKYDMKTNATVDYQEFLQGIPQNLRIELIMAMNSKAIETILFFQDKSPTFLGAILPLLKPIKVDVNQFLFMKGDPANEVYFIQTGSVDGVLSYRNTCTFTRILQGNMLGEVDIILHKEKRKYCFMTKKGAELLTLSKREFKKLILVEYREIGKQIMTQAEKKMKFLRGDYKKALIHFKKSREKNDVNNESSLEKKDKIEKLSQTKKGKFQRKSLNSNMIFRAVKDENQELKKVDSASNSLNKLENLEGEGVSGQNEGNNIEFSGMKVDSKEAAQEKEQDAEKVQRVEENKFEREETKKPFKFIGLLKAAVEDQEKDSFSSRPEPSIHITQYNDDKQSNFSPLTHKETLQSDVSKQKTTYELLFEKLISTKIRESALMEDSDEEQEIPLLSADIVPAEKMSLEEEENLKKTLEFIETRMKFLDEKILLLNTASKRLVTLLKSDEAQSNENSNIYTNTPIC